MASELEPEVQGLDRSLLECSAEETAGVSAGTQAGTSGRRRPRPGGGTDYWKSRSGRALTWGDDRAGPAGLALWVTAWGGPRSCSSPSFFIHEQPAALLGAPATLTYPFALPLFLLSPTLPVSPQHRAFALYVNSQKRGGKDASWFFGYFVFLIHLPPPLKPATLFCFWDRPRHQRMPATLFTLFTSSVRFRTGLVSLQR